MMEPVQPNLSYPSILTSLSKTIYICSYHEPMKVEKYCAEFVHEEDGTIVVDERTLKESVIKHRSSTKKKKHLRKKR